MATREPNKLTEQLSEQYFAQLAKCLHLKGAAACCHIAEWTARRWLQRGRKAIREGKDTNGERIYASFARRHDEVVQGHLAGYRQLVEDAGKGPKGDWRAISWLMERLDPEQWAGVDKEIREIKSRLRAMEGKPAG